MKKLMMIMVMGACAAEPAAQELTQDLGGVTTQGCRDECAWQSNCGIAVCSYCAKPNYFEKGICISGVALSPKERARLDAEREMEQLLGLGK